MGADASLRAVFAGSRGRLLAALGMSAIGGLYDDALRPRVIGLFAIVWLLPSMAGPALNAAIAVAAGWRWAMAWPALVVVVARVLVGRYADLIPASRERRPVAVGAALIAVGGLVVASVAGGSGRWGVAVLAAGLVAACAAGARLLAGAAADSRVLLCFAALGVAFFGGDVRRRRLAARRRGVLAGARPGCAGAGVDRGGVPAGRRCRRRRRRPRGPQGAVTRCPAPLLTRRRGRRPSGGAAAPPPRG